MEFTGDYLKGFRSYSRYWRKRCFSWLTWRINWYLARVSCCNATYYSSFTTVMERPSD